jgi:hypothetical protein
LPAGRGIIKRDRKKLLAFGCGKAYNYVLGLEESGELANRELKRNNSAENHINSQKPEQTARVHI